jgi:hypothetical protein
MSTFVSMNYLNRQTISDEDVDAWFNAIVAVNENRRSSLTCPEDENFACKGELTYITNFFCCQNKSYNALPDGVKKIISKLVAYISAPKKEWSGESLQVVPIDKIVNCLSETDFQDSQSSELTNGHLCNILAFEPARGCTPNINGIYGVMRVSGSYYSEDEAIQKASDVIKKFPANNLFIVKTGSPFFLTKNEKYFSGTTKVKMAPNSEKVDGETAAVKDMYDYMALKSIEMRQKEKQIEREISDRVAALKNDVSSGSADAVDNIIILWHKICCSALEYKATEKSLVDLKKKHGTQCDRVEKLLNENPSLRDVAMQKLTSENAKLGIDQGEDEQAIFLRDNIGKTRLI